MDYKMQNTDMFRFACHAYHISIPAICVILHPFIFIYPDCDDDGGDSGGGTAVLSKTPQFEMTFQRL